MHLYLLRHGDKLRSQTDPDVDLSSRGLAQASDLAQRICERGPEPEDVLCSPKRRTRSTLEPLGRRLNLKIQVLEELDEQRWEEPRAVFCRRVELTLRQLAEKGRSAVVCSHADWLAEAIRLIPSNLPDPEAEMHFGTCHFRLFEFDGAIWHYRAQYASIQSTP